MPLVPKFPANGFYYHYKHDANGSINNYAYEVMGVGCHTEDDCRPEDVHMVVYRPLYPAQVYTAGKLFDLRPLAMWMGDVTIAGRTFPRFARITDADVLAKLGRIRDEMYPSQPVVVVS
jgi:hypothetical protein